MKLCSICDREVERVACQSRNADEQRREDNLDGDFSTQAHERVRRSLHQLPAMASSAQRRAQAILPLAASTATGDSSSRRAKASSQGSDSSPSSTNPDPVDLPSRSTRPVRGPLRPVPRPFQRFRNPLRKCSDHPSRQKPS